MRLNKKIVCFFNVALMYLCLHISSCGMSQSKDVPVLVAQNGQMVYLLNTRSELVSYNVKDGAITGRSSVGDVRFPTYLFVKETADSYKALLFSDGGVNYRIISTKGINEGSNRRFSHVSQVIEYNQDVLVNTINGIYVCSGDSLEVIRRINCIDNDSTCDIRMSTSANGLVLSETDNLQGKTWIRILSGNYDQQEQALLNGIIKTRVHNSGKLTKWCYVKEEMGKVYFIVTPDIKTDHPPQMQLQGFQTGSEVFLDEKFIYYDGSSLRCINMSLMKEEWALPYHNVSGISNTDKYLCVQSANKIDVIDYSGKVIYSGDLKSAYTPVLFQEYLVVFDDDKGIRKIKIK